jgi:hypothetical protein
MLGLLTLQLLVLQFRGLGDQGPLTVMVSELSGLS